MTELGRFAKTGRIERNVLVCPKHKCGEPHRTMVSAEIVEAGKRTLALGSFSEFAFYS